eukprot:151379-Chlamydomonas_euryale.AAC.1
MSHANGRPRARACHTQRAPSGSLGSGVCVGNRHVHAEGQQRGTGLVQRGTAVARGLGYGDQETCKSDSEHRYKASPHNRPPAPAPACPPARHTHLARALLLRPPLPAQPLARLVNAPSRVAAVCAAFLKSRLCCLEVRAKCFHLCSK